MRLNDIIVESQQLDELTAADIGRGVGKVAKGVGAVAGGIAGIPGAVKKGFQAGKKTVAGDEDPAQQPAADPNAAAQPAAKTSGLRGAIDQFKKGFAQGRGAAPADQTTAQDGGTAAEPTAAAPAAQQQPAATAQQPAKAQSPLKAAQDAIGKLNKRQKQSVLNLLQKEFPQKAAAPAQQPAAAAPAQQQPAAEPAAKPAPAATKTEPQAAAPAQNAKYPGLPPGIDAERANAANAKVGLPPIYTQNPDGTWRETDQAKGTWVGDTGGATGITPAKKTRGGKKAAPTQAEIDADRERLMGVTSDSIIRTGNSLAETLAQRVEQHKRKMFETSLARGEFRVFK